MMYIPSKVLVNAVLLCEFLSAVSAIIATEERIAQHVPPASCAEALCFAGQSAESGIYQIRLLDAGMDKPFYVYCLRDPQGGGAWTLVQRRQDATVDFYRAWNDYKTGFGNLNTNFFIGLDKLHALTQSQLHELQIELRDFNDTVKYANYESFAVGDENEKYELNLLGAYSGDAGDSMLGYNDGRKFSTYDQDNDASTSNCAQEFKGAWWYQGCSYSNLNGVYQMGEIKTFADGVNGNSFRGLRYSLKYVHMAIRPKQFHCYNKA